MLVVNLSHTRNDTALKVDHARVMQSRGII